MTPDAVFNIRSVCVFWFSSAVTVCDHVVTQTWSIADSWLIVHSSLTHFLSCVRRLFHLYSQVELAVECPQPSSPRWQHVLCLRRSYQALLGRDATARLLHPTAAAGCQHGWHLPGASLSAGHRPGANHSTQHQHNLHHRWVMQTSSLSVEFVFWRLCVITGSRCLGGLYCVGRAWFLAAGASSARVLFRKIRK